MCCMCVGAEPFRNNLCFGDPICQPLMYLRAIQSVSSRRKEAHLVLAAKLVADDSTSSGGGKSTSKVREDLQ